MFFNEEMESKAYPSSQASTSQACIELKPWEKYLLRRIVHPDHSTSLTPTPYNIPQAQSFNADYIPMHRCPPKEVPTIMDAIRCKSDRKADQVEISYLLPYI